ncbi:hypothetical protein CRE_29363 [Caenorhabditis remanei]|uniref:Uncharacterized protein n=1 Tax=Caenorhabditis remanei TaxID=31234 RepID=E3MY29_CAERE|nr:hypothetical protein CRE_29363 [Caenorhabditis remanei]
MPNTLVIWILLVTCLHAGSAPNTTPPTATSDDSVTTSPPSRFDFDEQLSKINNSFLPCHEFNQLVGDLVSGDVADSYNQYLLKTAHRAIGLSELRTVLGFHQPVEWTAEYIRSDEVLKYDLTIEKYYERMESKYCYFLYTLFFESQLLSGMDFMDKHLPAVRNVYRRKFEENRRITSTKLIVDREEVDRMLENYIDIKDQMEDAIIGVLRNQKSCNSVDPKHEKKRKEDSEKVFSFHDF